HAALDRAAGAGVRGCGPPVGGGGRGGDALDRGAAGLVPARAGRRPGAAPLPGRDRGRAPDERLRARQRDRRLAPGLRPDPGRLQPVLSPPGAGRLVGSARARQAPGRDRDPRGELQPPGVRGAGGGARAAVLRPLTRVPRPAHDGPRLGADLRRDPATGARPEGRPPDRCSVRVGGVLGAVAGAGAPGGGGARVMNAVVGLARRVRAARGTELSCRGWPQEAALRMLMNNLDPEVAERPDDLVVYGGTGKAARSWEAFGHI